MYNGSISVEETRGKYIFWDIDGTLAPYRFNNHVGDPNGTNNGMSLQEIDDGCFLSRCPSLQMQNVINTCEARVNLIMGHCQNQKEMDDKKYWLDIYYPTITERNLTFEDIPKYQTILNYCSKNNIDLKDVIFVDDVIPFLREAERHGITSYHISSFLDWGMQGKDYYLKDWVSDDILNMRLGDTLCKHVFHTTSDKASRLFTESLNIGYEWCLWNTYSNHICDFDYDMGRILKMEADGYLHVLRIVKCRYEFSSKAYYWCDNIHSAIMYLRYHGLDVKLKEIPFYVIDLTFDKPCVCSYCGSVRNSDRDIRGAIQSALDRHKWSNSKEIIDIQYTLDDFINDNMIFYKYMHFNLKRKHFVKNNPHREKIQK